jgi:hypothetical protein
MEAALSSKFAPRKFHRYWPRRCHYGWTEQKIGAIQQIPHGGPSDQQTGGSAAQFSQAPVTR